MTNAQNSKEAEIFAQAAVRWGGRAINYSVVPTERKEEGCHRPTSMPKVSNPSVATATPKD